MPQDLHEDQLQRADEPNSTAPRVITREQEHFATSLGLALARLWNLENREQEAGTESPPEAAGASPRSP